VLAIAHERLGATRGRAGQRRAGLELGIGGVVLALELRGDLLLQERRVVVPHRERAVGAHHLHRVRPFGQRGAGDAPVGILEAPREAREPAHVDELPERIEGERCDGEQADLRALVRLAQRLAVEIPAHAEARVLRARGHAWQAEQAAAGEQTRDRVTHHR
jgi:hypothetical protein